MSWKIDNIDFKNYGVGVAKSSGVLDMPRIVDTSIDWLDQPGRDYWQDAADVKYEAREIALNCWIRANGYEDFKTKVSAFYAALIAPGERSLETYYGNVIEHITMAQSVQMVRKTQYVKSLQIGMFTLRLTVAGDSKLRYMDVSNDGWALPISVPYADGKLTRSLQGVSEITFTSEANSQQPHGTGNYIIYNEEKYYSLDYPAVDKIASNKLVYKLTYTHQFFLLKDVQFRILERSDFPWQSTVEEIIDKIIENGGRVYPGRFVKGSVVTTESRVNTFSNENCLEVLTRICTEYELEWEYKTIGTLIQINVKKTIGYEVPLFLEIGKANGLYKVSRTLNARENLCTRLYAYGSDKNIPASYGYHRLKLPVEPILFPFWGMQIEREKTFDDIFPMRTGIVTSYLKKTKADTWVYAPGTYPGPHPMRIYTSYPEDNTYELTDSAMNFDLMEKDVAGNTKYLIAGSTAKIHFNSGDLAGFEFEVLDYNHATKIFKLIPYTDSQGTKYPTDTLYPKPLDQYKILDINLPQSYIDDAEARLAVAANEWLTQLMTKENTYQIETKPGPYSNFGSFYPGWRIHLTDADLGISTLLRVIDISINLNTDVSTMTLSDWVKPGKIKELADKVGKLESAVEKAKLNDTNQVQGSSQTTAEVKNTIINPIDDKLNADKLIRNNDITPRMLAPDAGTPQFSIRDAQVEANVGGLFSKLIVYAGTLIVHNAYALHKPEIQEMEDNENPYLPAQEYGIDETPIELESPHGHFVYAKVEI